MQADRGIDGADLLLARELCDGDLPEVDPLQGPGILGLEFAGQLNDAVAHRSLDGSVDGRSAELVGEALQRAGLHSLTAAEVDHGVAQQAVEPGLGRLVAPQALERRDRTHEGGLKDVLGEGAIPKPGLQEAKEAVT
jgi:hypothetical protein